MPLSECSLEMLQQMRLKSVDDLFSDIPKEVRIEIRNPKQRAMSPTVERSRQCDLAERALMNIFGAILHRGE